jgi:MFS family permease
MTENNSSYSKTTIGTKEVILGRLSMGKLVFLCVVSLALSVVGPLSLFAPLPLAIAFLLYGVLKTFGVVAVIAVSTFALSTASTQMMELSYYGVILSVASLLAFAISSIILRGEHPVKGLLHRGFVVLGIILSLVVVAEVVSPEPLTSQIEAFTTRNFEVIQQNENYKQAIEAGGEQARILQEVFSNPKEVLSQFYQWVFAGVFVGIFFVLWITLFMILRNGMIWKSIHNYKYTIKDLVNFQVPEVFAYVVVLGLGLFIGGEYLGGPVLEIIGGNIIYCLGIFYFFQGMGVYIEFLKYLKITGFMRNVLTIMTIFFAYRVVAIAGLFDLWANFRKYFKKNEGDIS